ncbi:MAG: hypothetical protein ABIP39_11580 [Polyangiaceae bacterium]
MDIAYVAITEAATFMLDSSGVCRWVTSVPGSGHSKQAADRCVGAQYVASIDTQVEGALVELPRVGKPMIFAAIGENGRVSLVRTGPLLKFEAKRKPQSGVHERPTRPTGFAPVQVRPLRDDAIEDFGDINDVYRNEPATSRFTPPRVPVTVRTPPPSGARTVRSAPPPPPAMLRRMVGAPARAMRDESLDENPHVYRVPATNPRITTSQARAQYMRRAK